MTAVPSDPDAWIEHVSTTPADEIRRLGTCLPLPRRAVQRSGVCTGSSFRALISLQAAARLSMSHLRVPSSLPYRLLPASSPSDPLTPRSGNASTYRNAR
jgi:hypothetical protein